MLWGVTLWTLTVSTMRSALRYAYLAVHRRQHRKVLVQALAACARRGEPHDTCHQAQLDPEGADLSWSIYASLDHTLSPSQSLSKSFSLNCMLSDAGFGD